MRLASVFASLLAFREPQPSPSGELSTQTSLNSTLHSIPSISTFAGYAVEADISAFSDQSTAQHKLSVFAPTNAAIASLDTKPHEGPQTGPQPELTEPAYRARRKKFAGEWVLGHVAPVYPFSFTPGDHATMFERSTLRVEIGEGGGPEWRRAAINGAHIVEKRTTTGGDIYIVSDALFDWDNLREE